MGGRRNVRVRALDLPARNGCRSEKARRQECLRARDRDGSGLAGVDPRCHWREYTHNTWCSTAERSARGSSFTQYDDLNKGVQESEQTRVSVHALVERDPDGQCEALGEMRH